MYVQQPNRGFTLYGQQRCRRAPFLLLIQTQESSDIYGVVRSVALEQCGGYLGPATL